MGPQKEEISEEKRERQLSQSEREGQLQTLGMVTSMLKLLFLSVAIVVLSERLAPSLGASAANIRGMSIRDIRSAMGDSGEGGEVTDALKYLDELDKYYSQVARPRPARSLGLQPKQQQRILPVMRKRVPSEVLSAWKSAKAIVEALSAANGRINLHMMNRPGGVGSKWNPQVVHARPATRSVV